MQPDAVTVRDATPADIGAIARIYGHEVEHGIASFEEVAPSEADMQSRMAKIVDLGLPYLAAEDKDGHFLGYSYAGPYHTRAAYRYTVEDTIYIDAPARGCGVGRALLAVLIARCEAAGCRQMMALITGVDGSPSVALHEKMGFRTMGVAKAVGFKQGAWRDVVYMQRALGMGDSAAPDRPAPGKRI